MSSQIITKKTASSRTQLRSRVSTAFQKLWSIHWLMAGCYLVLFMGGYWMVRMPENSALQDNAYTLHKSFGALTMALLTWRILVLQRVVWQKYSRRLPKFTGKWFRTFLLHTAIYLFMLIVPLSGFFLSNSYQSGNVPFFWIATLQDIFPENEEVVELARDLHFWLAYTFLSLIVLHAIQQQKYLRSLWRRATQTLKKSVHS
ncbi:MAG: cytochrome b/b6 domain-containing protein [Elainellaceae cyanobacterium]